MYYLPEPPLGLLLFGFLIGITCGLAFDATLKLQVKQWQQEVKSGKPTDLSQMSRFLLPFVGVCVGICLFLAAGLEIFIYDRTISFAFATPLTLFTAGLVWGQLRNLIIQLLEGGSQALDLDAFY
jgi:hypothetical protein